MHRVQLWHFGGPEAEAGWRGIEPLASPLQAGASLPAAFVRHERFPQTFFVESASWSRKGFLHTRWQLGAAACDLVRRAPTLAQTLTQTLTLTSTPPPNPNPNVHA